MTLKILALDASSAACSVACYSCGGDEGGSAAAAAATIAERFAVIPHKHSLFILDFVSQTLAESGLSLAQLDAIAFACGPGSFTGLRLATSVVQGLALPHNLPVVPISTLHAMAYGAYVERGAEHVLVAVDARTQEIYWGEYALSCDAGDGEEGKRCMVPVAQDQLIKPEEARVITALPSSKLPCAQQTWGIGSGWEVYGAILKERCQQQCGYAITYDAECYPRARYVAVLAACAYRAGRTITGSAALPAYLREDIVRVNVAKQPIWRK